jgi:molecular chaperone DnaK
VLSEAAGKLAERAYAKAGAEGGAGSSPNAKNANAKDGDVVDAEFTEVNDDKK